jgi:hypothetical protein
MQSEFVKILDDIEKTNYNPEMKGKLQSATMLLWSLQNAESGGTGVVSWNGFTTSPITTPVLPIPTTEVIVEEKPQEEPKEIKKQSRVKKPKLSLEKDLNIKLSEINIDDL